MGKYMKEILNKRKLKFAKKVKVADLTNILIAVFIYIALYYVIIRYLPKLLMFFMPLILGFIISLISNSFVTKIENKFNVSRRRISLIIVILVTTLILGFLYLIIQAVYNEVLRVIVNISTITYDINHFIKETEGMINSLLLKLPFAISVREISIPTLTYENARTLINSVSTPVINFSVNFLKNIPVVIVNIIFVILSAYVLIIDNNVYREKAKIILPKSVHDLYRKFKEEVIYVFNGWLKAQIIIIGLVIMVLLIAFLLIKVKHPIFLSVLIAIVDALPIFGSGLFLWPWFVYSIIQGKLINALILLLAYLIIQFIRNVIQNRIMSTGFGLNGVVTILILFIGFKLYGFVGFIFSIPVGVFIISLYKLGLFDNFISLIKKLFLYFNDFVKQNL